MNSPLSHRIARNYGSLLGEANELSEEFIKIMYLLFGWDKPPETPDISFAEMQDAGIAYAQENSIRLSRDYLKGRDPQDFKFTVLHETGHCLDPLVVRGVTDKGDKERDETVANLSALIYLAKTEGLQSAASHARVRTTTTDGRILSGHTASKLVLSGMSLGDLEKTLCEMTRNREIPYLDAQIAA